VYALVDAGDEALVVGHRWRVKDVRGCLYAETSIPTISGQQSLLMHRLLMPELPYIDHRNGNGLDNRRSNIRPATHAQNMKNKKLPRTNTSGFKGVSMDKETGRWLARIYCDGRPFRLGGYATPEEAGMAYDEAALIYHGEFARTNAMLAATG